MFVYHAVCVCSPAALLPARAAESWETKMGEDQSCDVAPAQAFWTWLTLKRKKLKQPDSDTLCISLSIYLLHIPLCLDRKFQYWEIVRNAFQDVLQEMFRKVFQDVFQEIIREVFQEVFRENFRRFNG